jgi:hypothetical protein
MRHKFSHPLVLQIAESFRLLECGKPAVSMEHTQHDQTVRRFREKALNFVTINISSIQEVNAPGYIQCSQRKQMLHITAIQL